jgi:hypothetical protein
VRVRVPPPAPVPGGGKTRLRRSRWAGMQTQMSGWDSTMRIAPIFGLYALALAQSAQANEVRGGANGIAVFVGQATDTSFVTSMFMPWENEMEDIGVVGAAYSHRFGSVSELTGWGEAGGFLDSLLIEGEFGLSARFGDESLGEAWTGAYIRYDGFFWNDVVYTTLAVNTGVSYLTEKSDFERGRDENNRNSRLLHYMGPEITLALPEHKDVELLLRYHHRSGVFGLFDDVISGSTFISTGVRVRF